MGDIVKFYSSNAAEKIDNVLEQAIGQYERAIIIGYDKDGYFDVRASLNFKQKEIVYAIDLFKHRLFNGDYNETNR